MNKRGNIGEGILIQRRAVCSTNQHSKMVLKAESDEAVNIPCKVSVFLSFDSNV